MDQAALLRLVVYASAIEVALGALLAAGFVNARGMPILAGLSVLVVGLGLVTGGAAYTWLRTGV